jgi:hypothetical protein
MKKFMWAVLFGLAGVGGWKIYQIQWPTPHEVQETLWQQWLDSQINDLKATVAKEDADFLRQNNEATAELNRLRAAGQSLKAAAWQVRIKEINDRRSELYAQLEKDLAKLLEEQAEARMKAYVKVRAEQAKREWESARLAMQTETDLVEARAKIDEKALAFQVNAFLDAAEDANIKRLSSMLSPEHGIIDTKKVRSFTEGLPKGEIRFVIGNTTQVWLGSRHIMSMHQQNGNWVITPKW